MQTQFSITQLSDPDIAQADGILRKCVHCGFCTATCPTYVLTGDERDSPRGRIWLIRDMLENDDADKTVAQHHLDRCLTCLSCVTTCPSGVDYMHLVDIGRRHARKDNPRPLFERLKRRLLIEVLSSPKLAYSGFLLAYLARPLKPLISLLKLAPKKLPRFDRVGSRDQIFSPDDKKRRVILLQGCVQRAIDPEINAATIRLLNRLGVEVIVKKAASCCGSMEHHAGDETAAKAIMQKTIAAWMAEDRQSPLDAIIVNASGCGTVVKDYGEILGGDPDASRTASLAMDITEYIASLGIESIAPRQKSGRVVAYHAACSLQHGQQIKTIPAELLRQVGFEVKAIAESHLCCGSAGTYNILQPKLARQLQARKIKAIEAADAEIIAAGNLGCMVQLQDASAPIVHTVQLLDWATGGARPKAIAPNRNASLN